jgi:Caenorhabditis protein of unknown function, DUF268
MRKLFNLLHWMLFGQMGINLGKIKKVFLGIPRFLKDSAKFKKQYQGEFSWMPCLTDWYEEGGSARGEYFWQDLYVARKIFEANPKRHIDVGSRVDGFIAHVASFREIEVFDIRPNTAKVPGIVFRQADLMNLDDTLAECCDSLSCLHALEHFGLGRYGDPIDPLGHEAALQNMAKLLSERGTFYLAVPIGRARVEFNGMRVLEPINVENLAITNGLELKEFAFVGAGDVFTTSLDTKKDFERLAKQDYALGIFTFQKTS